MHLRSLLSAYIHAKNLLTIIIQFAIIYHNKDVLNWESKFRSTFNLFLLLLDYVKHTSNLVSKNYNNINKSFFIHKLLPSKLIDVSHSMIFCCKMTEYKNVEEF